MDDDTRVKYLKHVNLFTCYKPKWPLLKNYELVAPNMYRLQCHCDVLTVAVEITQDNELMKHFFLCKDNHAYFFEVRDNELYCCNYICPMCGNEAEATIDLQSYVFKVNCSSCKKRKDHNER